MLEKFFILIHKALVQHSRYQVSFAAVVIEGNQRHLLQIIIKTVAAFHIINNPLLIGKAVFEMLHRKRQSIILRFESREKRAVRRLLKTDKLHYMHTLTVHLLPNLCKPEDVLIGKIRFDRARRINRLADITENKNTDLRKLRQPTLRETAKRGRRNLLLQSPPHTRRLLLVSDYGVQIVTE